MGQTVILIQAVLFLLSFFSAQARTESSLLSKDDALQRWVMWTNASNPESQGNYFVDVRVNGIDFEYVPVDTGSTGFLISAQDLHYTNESELKKCCKPAFEFLSSSRRFYEGYWLPSNLTFTSVTGRLFHSHIPVFAVTESGNCSSFTDGKCTKDVFKNMPSGIKYMGVGFGRWSSEQPDATADKNPLLNIDLANDQALESGYVIGREGLILGVRARDLTDGWQLVNLSRNTAANLSSDRPEWNGVPMCVMIAGSECYNGTALFDTGINYSFLGVAPEATRNLNETVGKFIVLQTGTNVAVRVGHPGNDIFNFSFVVGDFNTRPRITPEMVRLVHEHVDGAFINTGRYFYNAFSLIFAEKNGVIGLKKASSHLIPDYMVKREQIVMHGPF